MADTTPSPATLLNDITSRMAYFFDQYDSNSQAERPFLREQTEQFVNELTKLFEDHPLAAHAYFAGVDKPLPAENQNALEKFLLEAEQLAPHLAPQLRQKLENVLGLRKGMAPAPSPIR
ncbi:MAG: hypothetical protein JSS53_00635 [Proteobacteria bacterium]|nr:hypothetical protein [Pseudomonadota bacterium]